MKSVLGIVARALVLGILLVVPPACAQDGGDLVARGERVFMLQGCYGCHTVGRYGTPIGPDLSQIGRRFGESRLGRWLRDPAEQRPTAHMPRLELTATEVQELAAFLASLR